MRHSGFVLGAVGVALLLAGCGSSTAPAAEAGNNGAPQTRYDMANRCFALQSVAQNTYAVHNSDGSYTASAATVAAGEPFFMKPTALGKYMFYAKDATYLAVSGSGVGSAKVPAEAVDWTVDLDAANHYTVFSASANKSLTVDPASHALTLGDAGPAAEFGFAPATGCTDYPEAQLNTTGSTFKGQGVDKPVLGFADVHNHISATTFLGGAHYGAPFNRFGITVGLKNCEAVHGPDGATDVIGNLEGYNTPIRPHDTVGWPTFVDWPAAASLTHEGTYYKWIERAWMAGLRVLVSNTVENQTLCNLESKVQGHLLQNCNEMDSAAGQAQFMHDLQDYIDAQEGGPGKGWFRIVESPADARRVINDGKLAVVLGVEISHLFNCSVTYLPGGGEVDGCTKSDIDTQLDRLYNLGIREMFSIHEFDNALGGNGIFNGLVLNVGNFIDTGRFWSTYNCPVEVPFSASKSYNYNDGAVMTTSDPTGLTDPLTAALLAGTGVVIPIYPDKPQCNARGLTDLGRYAFSRMMSKKIIMDIDHMELSIKSDLISMAEQQSPQYPLLSAHGGYGGLSQDQARRIINVGGLIYPYHTNPPDWIATLNQSLLPLQNPKYYFAMGYGADTNGLGAQASACTDCKAPVTYPFTLFKGPDWGSEFAGVAPVTFDREVTGQRTFDVNAEGQAHYGLKADWVEQLRIEGGEPALNALYHSAEAYLEMWERTENR
ncbi:peptidase M19 [Nevskia soli]|uniref:peptidase M19 n=1 Tax=Nevskia soli TaxID=418856 RepID=UPI0012FA808D|nr:peptidase M19 [Nevskia soli]